MTTCTIFFLYKDQTLILKLSLFEKTGMVRRTLNAKLQCCHNVQFVVLADDIIHTWAKAVLVWIHSDTANFLGGWPLVILSFFCVIN